MEIPGHLEPLGAREYKVSEDLLTVLLHSAQCAEAEYAAKAVRGTPEAAVYVGVYRRLRRLAAQLSDHQWAAIRLYGEWRDDGADDGER